VVKMATVTARVDENVKKEGKFVIYYPNGKIYMASNFVNDKHNGEINYFL
jgi:hypothetical protein